MEDELFSTTRDKSIDLNGRLKHSCVSTVDKLFDMLYYIQVYCHPLTLYRTLTRRGILQIPTKPRAGIHHHLR